VASKRDRAETWKPRQVGLRHVREVSGVDGQGGEGDDES
jgi:hypothetical protein